jgi:hypothetical protein
MQRIVKFLLTLKILIAIDYCLFQMSLSVHIKSIMPLSLMDLSFIYVNSNFHSKMNFQWCTTLQRDVFWLILRRKIAFLPSLIFSTPSLLLMIGHKYNSSISWQNFTLPKNWTWRWWIKEGRAEKNSSRWKVRKNIDPQKFLW